MDGLDAVLFVRSHDENVPDPSSERGHLNFERGQVERLENFDQVGD